MNRSIIFTFRLVIALAAVLTPAAALADDPAPTPAQIEQAKKAFAEGKKLHEAGKHAEAVEKFKESYRLSKNPLLLYNIAFTFDEAKEEDMALFYYRKFLKDAPADAAQRPTVTDRVKVIEQQFNPNAGNPTNPTPTPPDPNDPNAQNPQNPPTPKKPDPAPRGPIVIKPLGTYSANDFQHQVIETAPPAKPLDITAFVPEDSGFTVTLYFRTAGEGKFTAKPMKWRYKELVGRVPAPKMIGNAVQYYIEVKDTAGNVVTRNAKSTSPNLVNLEAGATPRFYPDLSDDGEAKLSDADIKQRDEEDDPLNKHKKPPPKKVADPETGPAIPEKPTEPGTGFNDVGSQKFKYTKLGTTIGAGSLLALSIVFYLQAGKYSNALEEDSTSCGTPPCLKFDSYGADVQSTGKTYQTLTNVAFGFGLATAAVAGYFWYRELTSKKTRETARVSKRAPSPEAGASSWLIAPSVGDGFAGAAAAARF